MELHCLSNYRAYMLNVTVFVHYLILQLIAIKDVHLGFLLFRFKQLYLKNLSDNLNTHVFTQLFEQTNMQHLQHLTLTDCLAVQDCTVQAISLQ